MLEAEAVIGYARLDALLEPELADARLDATGVAAHDFAAAMSENGTLYALFSAPGELRAYGHVPDQVIAAPTHQGAGHRGAVADVKCHSLQRFDTIPDGGEVWDIEYGEAPGLDPIADRRRSQRMGDHEGLKCDRTNPERMSGLNPTSIGEREPLDQRPSLVRRIDGARCALSEPEGVVGVSMCEYDCRGINGLQPAQPIGTAIDHHAGTALPHQQGAVAEVAARPEFDLAAGSEKGELDCRAPSPS